MLDPTPQPHTSPSAACGIAAHAMVAAPLSGITALRDAAGPPGCPPLPSRFLRHSDEHTVVGMQAVRAAIATLPEADRDCSLHGVIAAPCQAGRILTATSLALLATGGGVTVSPHIVPQCSLHSLAGAISVALGMKGPHLGVSGGPDAIAEGLFTALSLLHEPAAGMAPPGMWLVFTAWDDEPALAADGAALDDPTCRAVALLLRPGATAPLGLVLDPAAAVPAGGLHRPLVDFTAIIDRLATGDAAAAWPLPGRVPGAMRLVSSSTAAACGREAA